MTAPEYAGRLRALADHLDPGVAHHAATVGDVAKASPGDLRAVAAILDRIWQGGDRPAPERP